MTHTSRKAVGNALSYMQQLNGCYTDSWLIRSKLGTDMGLTDSDLLTRSTYPDKKLEIRIRLEDYFVSSFEVWELSSFFWVAV